MVDQPMPELFGSNGCTPPAEMDDHIRTAGDCLPGTSSDQSRIGGPLNRHPGALCSAELFHNPEIPAFDAAN
ncbi:hypothetical protein D3C75_752950 [compost metagenome]